MLLLFCERCSCVLFRDVGKDRDASYSHFTCESFPADAGKELVLLTVSDDNGSLLKKWCLEAIEALPEEVQPNVRDGVMNQIMKKVVQLSGGRAKAGDVRQMLEDLLMLYILLY